ncbi:MAG TPA: hypothetical protein VI299_07260, partial [Polyangiales bacterium]
GLSEGEQASTPLCASLRGGQTRSFTIDARKLDISNVTLDNREAAHLAIWGGTSANCNARELLYLSPKLGLEWQRLCVTVTAVQFTDQLTLQAISDQSQPTIIYVLADNITPVAGCP